MNHYSAFARFLTGAGLCLLSIITVSALPLDNWYLRYSIPSGIPFSGVAYGNGRFVAVGGAGRVAASADGKNWDISFPTTNNLNSVTYGLGQFVAVGVNRTILTSSDGVNWVPRALGTNITLLSIECGSNIFVGTGIFSSPIAGFRYTIRSTDGIDWSFQDDTGASFGSELTFGNGLFVYIHRTGTIRSTQNGINWWTQSMGTNVDLYSIGFGNGTFVAVDHANRILTSGNGTNWTVGASIPLSRASDIVFAKGYWVVVGISGNPVYSADLIHWSTSPTGGGGTDCTFGNGTFVTAWNTLRQSDPLIQLQGVGSGSLYVSGPTNQLYRFEALEDLGATNWQVVNSVMIDTDPYLWTDPDPAPRSKRFYRAVLP